MTTCARLLDARQAGEPQRIVGVISDQALGETWERDTGLASLGGLRDLDRILDEHRPATLVVSDRDAASGAMDEILAACRARHISLKLSGASFDFGDAPISFVPDFGTPVFVASHSLTRRLSFVVKRLADVLVGAAALVVLSPLFVVVALLVKATSPGPVFFVDTRVGLGQRPFRCYKFRTMGRDAADRQEYLEHLNQAEGAIFKIKDDPRVTRVGRTLRKTSIDELPQLINVVKGDMSIVGPRPLPLRDFELMEDWHKRRHVVLPGITGLWQVSGRSELGFDDMLALDDEYITTWSLASDARIVWRTVAVVFGRKGAY
jgi:exopolysaccharide biosynthesis polyprenyl glycosylphosphotransferase